MILNLSFQKTANLVPSYHRTTTATTKKEVLHHCVSRVTVNEWTIMDSVVVFESALCEQFMKLARVRNVHPSNAHFIVFDASRIHQSSTAGRHDTKWVSPFCLPSITRSHILERMDLTDRLGSSGSKLLALVVLGVGSLASGAAPLYLDQRQARARTARNSTLLITVLLCFGAGVLLATALVHMLSDVRLYLPRYAEVVFCGGFFLIYVIEELVQLWRTGVNQPKVLTNGGEAADCCSSGDSISLLSVNFVLIMKP